MANARNAALTGEAFGGRRQDTEPTFRSLVGEKGWASLPAMVRKRFAAAPPSGNVLLYTGTMQKMNCTLLGRIFAFLCSPLGRPLPGFEGADIPAFARVYTVGNGRGVMWERHYLYPGRKPVTVKSMKKLHPRYGLLEYTRAGLGMFLDVYERDRDLYFESTGYFLQIGKRFFRIPKLLTPGKALVRHRDLGQGQFEFSLVFDHPNFGRLFDQSGIFSLEGDQK